MMSHVSHFIDQNHMVYKSYVRYIFEIDTLPYVPVGFFLSRWQPSFDIYIELWPEMSAHKNGQLFLNAEN